MRKQTYLLTLLLLAILCPLAAKGEITIEGSNTTQVNTLTTLYIKGLTPGMETYVTGSCNPMPNGLFIGRFLGAQQYVIVFQATKPGTYTIQLELHQWSKNLKAAVEQTYYSMKDTEPNAVNNLVEAAKPLVDKYLPSTVKFDLVVEGVGPGPNPPNPPGPQPGEKHQLLFLYESNDLQSMPLPRRALLTSLTLRNKINSLGHKVLGYYDKDEKTPSGVAPAILAPFLVATESHSLPCVAVAPKAGGVIEVFDLPENEAALLKLLGGDSD